MMMMMVVVVVTMVVVMMVGQVLRPLSRGRGSRRLRRRNQQTEGNDEEG
jgi:hypothetical protein